MFSCRFIWIEISKCRYNCVKLDMSRRKYIHCRLLFYTRFCELDSKTKHHCHLDLNFFFLFFSFLSEKLLRESFLGWSLSFARFRNCLKINGLKLVPKRALSNSTEHYFMKRAKSQTREINNCFLAFSATYGHNEWSVWVYWT